MHLETIVPISECMKSQATKKAQNLIDHQTQAMIYHDSPIRKGSKNLFDDDLKFVTTKKNQHGEIQSISIARKNNPFTMRLMGNWNLQFLKNLRLVNNNIQSIYGLQRLLLHNLQELAIEHDHITNFFCMRKTIMPKLKKLLVDGNKDIKDLWISLSEADCPNLSQIGLYFFQKNMPQSEHDYRWMLKTNSNALQRIFVKCQLQKQKHTLYGQIKKKMPKIYIR